MPPSPWTFFRRFPNQSAPALLNPRAWARNALYVGESALFLHIFFTYVGGVGFTDGISMMPTIPHSYNGHPLILYSSLYRRGRNIKVGDVVTYTNPMFPTQSGCKRVIGMPGDFVSVVTAGRGEADAETVDVDNKWASVKEEVIRVPEGHCWVAGDNLEWSRDSRLFGPLPLGLVKAKVLAVMLPFGERKWLGSKVDIADAKEVERKPIIR
ncbi:LexA/Signal peptidase [Plenodomus tracheiphilus IPT5]|uniref:Mitochondrial inner membrane protease subunit n=1 Tax=Plenodomus tracheiphilus IPT5 TaxID=1408161 RepID=A0A6A7B8Q9_9PLEO|nr:LexA/Signal peptidase [Plenodomus tracheiphilus IPT5]